MKKLFFLFGFFFFTILFSFAQPKKITYESHSENMTRYADSMKRVDSLHVDSLNKANRSQTQKKSGKKRKGIHGEAFILRPKETVIGFQ